MFSKMRKSLFFSCFAILRFENLFSREKTLETSRKKVYKYIKDGNRNFNPGLNVTSKLILLETDHKTQLGYPRIS